MSELDETALQFRLRALRAAPPDTNFEQRLLERLHAVQRQPLAAVRARRRTRRLAPVIAAGVLLAATSAAAWFTAIVLPEQAGPSEAKPAARSAPKARPANHGRMRERPSAPTAAPDVPPQGTAPDAVPAAAQPTTSVRAPHDEPHAQHAGRALDTNDTRGRQRRQAHEPPDNAQRVVTAEPAAVPEVVAGQAISEMPQRVVPERLQISAPQPAISPGRELGELRSRTMQERVRNVAWERRDVREASRAADTSERGERNDRANAVREQHRTDVRERREHSSKK